MVLKVLSAAFIPGTSPLERVIISRAIGTSIISNIANEISLEQLIINIPNLSVSSDCLWISSLVLVYIYGTFKYESGAHTKFANIAVYDKWDRRVREIFIILFLVFTRDMKNAI